MTTRRWSRIFHEGAFFGIAGVMIAGFLGFDLLHGTRSGVMSDLILIGLFVAVLALRHLNRRHEARRAEETAALRERIKSEMRL